jgi:hypothetical protein
MRGARIAALERADAFVALLAALSPDLRQGPQLLLLRNPASALTLSFEGNLIERAVAQLLTPRPP